MATVWTTKTTKTKAPRVRNFFDYLILKRRVLILGTGYLKVLIQVLLCKLQRISVATTDDLQYGFKKHSSCSHALITFKESVKYFVQKGSKVQCVSLDASKAFDKVLHHGLFVKLINKGVPAVFIRLLCNWYKRMKCSVLWNNVLGDIFDVNCGVRQGGVLSPILFSIYVDDLIGEQ